MRNTQRILAIFHIMYKHIRSGNVILHGKMLCISVQLEINVKKKTEKQQQTKNRETDS